jgi:hypothetical protein
MGGKVEACDHREYGYAMLDIHRFPEHPFADKLLEGIDSSVQVMFCFFFFITKKNFFLLMCFSIYIGLDVSW